MAKKTLVASTSGVRGIIGPGLTPVLATKYAAAFGSMLKSGTVVIGRDSRPTGDIIMRSAISGLAAVGIDVVDIGIVPTPTVEIAVKELKAKGGICITASHNPAPWNALKFFNDRGEFITPAQYDKLNDIYTNEKFAFKRHDKVGSIERQDVWIDKHIKKTLALKTVNKGAIKRRKFSVVVDAINGAGSHALPTLLKLLGAKVVEINCDGDGNFVHEPEPVPKNLAQLGKAVRKHKADLGMACDPDADRLALVDATGEPIGEELTLAIAVRHILSKQKGPTVLNLSTSKATVDTAEAAGSKVYLSKVGESNVVEMMRKKKAVIGGEGNGGVIYPSFHAGRDSLVAAALTLSCLAEEKLSLKEMAETLPAYYAIKSKATLPDDFSKRLARFEKDAAEIFGRFTVDRRDGLRFDFDGGWAQIRSSNTEPIYRLIVETDDRRQTDRLNQMIRRFFSK